MTDEPSRPAEHEPSLSVVIPTHGERRSVLETVQAILAHDYAHLEIIVVTDGPSEAAFEVLSGIPDPRLTILEQPKRGSAATRNAGLQAATGEWVAFVDDDDVPRPNWIGTWRRGVTPGTGVVVAAVARHKSGAMQVRPCRLDPADQTMSASTLLAGAFWVRRRLLLAIDGYDLALKASQNHDLGLRLCDLLASNTTSPAVNTSPEPVIDVYVQAPQQRSTRYGGSRADAASLYLNRYADRLVHDRTHHASLLRIIAHAERLRGNNGVARRTALGAVRLEPKEVANWRSLAVSLAPAFIRPG